MNKEAKHTEQYVTQTQWAEGMEMIKNFFGKIVSRIDDFQQIQEDFNQEQRQINHGQRQLNKEMVKNVQINTDSLVSMTKEMKKINEREFVIYNHEKRIEKLEQAR